MTNEFAYWNPTDPRSVASPTWELTSGSLFAKGGRGWTGTPDDQAPDPLSAHHTNSSVFRLTTRRANFTNIKVSFDLVNIGFTTAPTTPATAWDGVHVFLRYQSETSLYYASVNRRDGSLAIKKKVPGGTSNGGTYYTLASTPTGAFPLGRAQRITTTVRTTPTGGVQLAILRPDGTTALSTTDSGTGGPPITGPGRTGIRGDNCNFTFDNFTVTNL